MSQQQGFGTGNGGGPGGDVKSICITENVLFSSSISLAAPICILPDANGAISFTADPPIILTAIPNGLNISFSGSTGGIGFLQGNDAINVGPDAMQIVKLIGNNTQGVSVTNTGPNELTVTIADATSTQKGVVTLGEAGAGITSINNIAPDAMSNFNITATTPYTVSPITNGINISDNGSIPYTYTTTSGTKNFVNNNLSIFSDDLAGEFFTRNDSIGLRYANAGVSLGGLIQLATNSQVLLGVDFEKAVTPGTLRALTGPLTANTVLISTGPNTAITNSNLGTAGQGLFSNGGTSPPAFGSFTSNDSTIAIVFDEMTNSLDFRVTGSLPGSPNIEFLAGNDSVNVGPDPTTHVLKILGNNTQGVSVTNTGPNELTITVADATSTQKGVVTLGESGAGITTINSILPDGANNFNITATVPYTVTPGTNSVNIGDNGGVPYQFVPDIGNPVTVTGNSFTIKGDDPIVTKVFDFQPTNFYVTVKQADYGFYGVNRLAFGTDVLAGTGKQSVTCETLRVLTGPLTTNTILIATGPTTAITNSSVGTAGQTIFSNGGTSIPNFGSFTSTSGTITFSYNSGSNSLDVNANIPVDPLPLVQLSSSTPLSTNTCYMFIAGSDSYALPTTSAVNDLLELKVQGASSYTITQAAGQSVFLGNTNTTVGTGGFFTCNGPGDWIRLRCTVANTTWVEFGMSAQSFLVT